MEGEEREGVNGRGEGGAKGRFREKGRTAEGERGTAYCEGRKWANSRGKGRERRIMRERREEPTSEKRRRERQSVRQGNVEIGKAQKEKCGSLECSGLKRRILLSKHRI